MIIPNECRELKVGIDARLADGRHGGVQQAVIGLAHGLSTCLDGSEKYYFLCHAGHEEWLKHSIHGPCDILLAPHPKTGPMLRAFDSSAFLRRLFATFGHFIPPMLNRLPVSDGTVEARNVELMHFTFQSAFKISLPSIYQPWDLQHVHLPEFFPKWQRLRRDYKYRAYCQYARLVVVASSGIRDELITHYRLPRGKVAVIPMAAPVEVYPNPGIEKVAEVRRKFSLPASFALFPAHTYPHKNHLLLLQALDLLRSRHKLKPIVICTGSKTSFFRSIERGCRQLDLDNQVRFLDYVSPMELKCIFSLCRFLIFPSRYEGWGLPVTEALRLARPVACSDLKVLREQAGDAALYFNPTNTDAIANAIARLWSDDSLHQKLSKRARSVSAHYSWEKTARTFRAHYRRLCGRPLSNEDANLISESF
jgi:glycosyltransferase involved in cell wall biosynthesis